MQEIDDVCPPLLKAAHTASGYPVQEMPHVPKEQLDWSEPDVDPIAPYVLFRDHGVASQVAIHPAARTRFSAEWLFLIFVAPCIATFSLYWAICKSVDPSRFPAVETAKLPFVIWLLLTTLSLASWFRLRIRNNRRAARILKRLAERRASTTALLSVAFRCWSRGLNGFDTADICRLLTRANMTGVVVRISTYSPPSVAEPLLFAFEPVDLRKEPRRVAALAYNDDPIGMSQAATEGAWPRWTLPFRLGAYFFLALMLLPLLGCLLSILELALTGDPTSLVVFFIILTPLLVALLRFAFEPRMLSRGAPWLAVPGGVVVRLPRRLAYFDRRNSNLVLDRLRNARTQATLSQGELLARTELSAAAAQFLTRAWLSPVEPPTVEQLAEFA